MEENGDTPTGLALVICNPIILVKMGGYGDLYGMPPKWMGNFWLVISIAD